MTATSIDLDQWSVNAIRAGAGLANMWLADRGTAPLTPNGIKIRLKRLGAVAGVDRVHAHRWRHSFAHGLAMNASMRSKSSAGGQSW